MAAKPEACDEADARWQILDRAPQSPGSEWEEPVELWWRPGPVNDWQHRGNFQTRVLAEQAIVSGHYPGHTKHFYR